jgi:hypothetical protein
MHLQSHTAYRLAVSLALVTAIVIVWLNAAGGLIGIEDDDPANLLYAGVLAIGFIGAIITAVFPEPAVNDRAARTGALHAHAVGRRRYPRRGERRRRQRLGRIRCGRDSRCEVPRYGEEQLVRGRRARQRP